MSLKSKLWIIGVGALLLALVVSYAVNPLKHSDKALHTWLLSRVPMGSDVEHLKRVASQENWSGWASWTPEDNSHTVVRVQLGHYYAPFRTDLSSFCDFDASGRLIDVRTQRDTDAP
jgi:hypothetical protein